MSLSILTNTSAMQTEISLNNSSNSVSTAMQRLLRAFASTRRPMTPLVTRSARA